MWNRNRASLVLWALSCFHDAPIRVGTLELTKKGKRLGPKSFSLTQLHDIVHLKLPDKNPIKCNLTLKWMDQLEMYFALYHLRQCIFDKGTLLPQPLQSINQTCSIQLTMSLITMKSLIKQYRSITKILVFIGRNHTCVYKIYIPIQCRKITDVFVEKLKIKETLITC